MHVYKRYLCIIDSCRLSRHLILLWWPWWYHPGKGCRNLHNRWKLFWNQQSKTRKMNWQRYSAKSCGIYQVSNDIDYYRPFLVILEGHVVNYMSAVTTIGTIFLFYLKKIGRRRFKFLLKPRRQLQRGSCSPETSEKDYRYSSSREFSFEESASP